ncbi:MAG TPA: hypothetical protein VG847_05370 [Chitinophagaceae bacterium]|nr:hypothetical protein [Chitinophagaceae bacterium]
MKKIIIALFFLAGTLGFTNVNAQKKTSAKTTTTTATTTHTKKDGTLDMRYKENKEKKAPAGPLKKNGTPDMRYKANKQAASTSSSTKAK